MLKQCSLLILTLACAMPAGLDACFAKPPDHVILETNAPNLFIRKDNTRGVMEIRKSDSLDLSWEVKIDSYDSLFSTVKLSPDGKRLYHILGNHAVGKLDDTVVEIYTKDGLETQYAAKDAIDELKPGGGFSTSPARQWRGGEDPQARVNAVVVKLANGKTAQFKTDKHEVTVYETKS